MGAKSCNRAEGQTGKAVQVMNVKETKKDEYLKVKKVRSLNQEVLARSGSELDVK